MTPDSFRQALTALGLSQTQAAKVLGISPRTARRYAKRGAPDWAAVNLNALIALQSIKEP